jgi:hypothetical protein
METANMNPTLSADAVIEALKSQHARGDLASMRATCRGVPDEALLALVSGEATLTDEGESWSIDWDLDPTPVDSDLAVALDQALTRARVAELDVAELLERIALVTGVDLSTEPTGEAVAAGLVVLDSLASPTTEKPGHYWGDPLGNASPEGITGPFDAPSDAFADALGHADELPHGFVTLHVRDGKMLAPMFVPPTQGRN